MAKIREWIWTIAAIIIIWQLGLRFFLMFLAYTFRFYFGFVLSIAFFIALILAICFGLILIRRGTKYFREDEGKNVKRIREVIWTIAAILVFWQNGIFWLSYLFFILGLDLSHFIVFLVLLLFIASIIAVFRNSKKQESG